MPDFYYIPIMPVIVVKIKKADSDDQPVSRLF